MSSVRRCEGQEDPKCSHSIRKTSFHTSATRTLIYLPFAASSGINPAHGVYFGQGARMFQTTKMHVVLTSLCFLHSSDDNGRYPLPLVNPNRSL